MYKLQYYTWPDIYITMSVHTLSVNPLSKLAGVLNTSHHQSCVDTLSVNPSGCLALPICAMHIPPTNHLCTREHSQCSPMRSVFAFSMRTTVALTTRCVATRTTAMHGFLPTPPCTTQTQLTFDLSVICFAASTQRCCSQQQPMERRSTDFARRVHVLNVNPTTYFMSSIHGTIDHTPASTQCHRCIPTSYHCTKMFVKHALQ